MADVYTSYVIPGTPTAQATMGQQQDAQGVPIPAKVEDGVLYGPLDADGDYTLEGTLVVGYPLLDPADVRAGVDIGDGTLGAMSVNTVSGYVVSGVGGVGVVSGT